MRAYHHMTQFLFLSLISSLIVVPQDSIGKEDIPRRILHQPLFPVSSAPPQESEPPPSPPPPVNPVFPNPDQPFFPEQPNGPSTDQTQSPPPPAAGNASTVPNPLATQPNKPTKKVAIAISVGIVTLGMLSALAFYLYKHRVKTPSDTHSQKLVGGNSQSRSFQDESRAPQSNILYIGTVEPASRASVSDTNGGSSSPYRKLKSIKISDRYRPSPDLQPLPPLTKPPLPTMNSPPPMTSSDEEESRDSAFYTPQCSSFSNDEGSYASNQSTTNLVNRAKPTTSSIPHSKRTSPKSRFSASSPEMKPSQLEPPTQLLPQVQYSNPTFSYSPKRPKFSSPPPPPDMARLLSITNRDSRTFKPPVPPPPPPPPRPPIPIPKMLKESEASLPPQELRQPQSRILNPRANFEATRTKPVEEANRDAGSSERNEAEDEDGSRPKLKPLHWDKVRATSERATVWDQLKSSSFQ